MWILKNNNIENWELQKSIGHRFIEICLTKRKMKKKINNNNYNVATLWCAIQCIINCVPIFPKKKK